MARKRVEIRRHGEENDVERIAQGMLLSQVDLEISWEALKLRKKTNSLLLVLPTPPHRN